MSEYAAVVLITVGVVFDLLGCVGLIRLPDVYTRLQASTKAVTLGTCLILIGVAVWAFGSGRPATGVKALICAVFVLITSPTAAHALARGAYKSGVKMEGPPVCDAYSEEAKK